MHTASPKVLNFSWGGIEKTVLWENNLLDYYIVFISYELSVANFWIVLHYGSVIAVSKYRHFVNILV